MVRKKRNCQLSDNEKLVAKKYKHNTEFIARADENATVHISWIPHDVVVEILKMAIDSKSDLIAVGLTCKMFLEYLKTKTFQEHWRRLFSEFHLSDYDLPTVGIFLLKAVIPNSAVL